ncbi:hypothetical protein NDU88_000005 [Pleurodeles waltl]|uniref:Uncharacterized protein n=1 Tax=Pleurodeles waltl TaxID=8319 RepID=A0AAV7V3W8_PLEWA|nr:hypothetical protein NDU88_008083 [Pleurodeles waltl]KAJ1196129.1 hypothetical protein NDU88_000005 [Pleurodeles waltl]
MARSIGACDIRNHEAQYQSTMVPFIHGLESIGAYKLHERTVVPKFSNVINTRIHSPFLYRPSSSKKEELDCWVVFCGCVLAEDPSTDDSPQSLDRLEMSDKLPAVEPAGVLDLVCLLPDSLLT